jgi:hypothetical protein
VPFLTSEQKLELQALEFEGRLNHQTSLADELANNVGTFQVSFEVIKAKVFHAEVCV